MMFQFATHYCTVVVKVEQIVKEHVVISLLTD